MGTVGTAGALDGAGVLGGTGAAGSAFRLGGPDQIKSQLGRSDTDPRTADIAAGIVAAGISHIVPAIIDLVFIAAIGAAFTGRNPVGYLIGAADDPAALQAGGLEIGQ